VRVAVVGPVLMVCLGPTAWLDRRGFWVSRRKKDQKEKKEGEKGNAHTTARK
jgi:hypothetical protein